MATRAYEQVARAEATERTRRAVLDAALSLFEQEHYDLPLDLVAERAGVSTRTLLRHFGSKDGMLEAAMAEGETRVARSRAAPPGDAATAVRRLVDHYEQMGDGVLRRLAEAERLPILRRVIENGTRMHLELVEEAFAPDLDGLGTRERKRRAALLASVTDVYVWALLRRRHGLSRKETEAAIRGLVDHARGESR